MRVNWLTNVIGEKSKCFGCNSSLFLKQRSLLQSVNAVYSLHIELKRKRKKKEKKWKNNSWGIPQQFNNLNSIEVNVMYVLIWVFCIVPLHAMPDCGLRLKQNDEGQITDNNLSINMHSTGGYRFYVFCWFQH